VNHLLAHFDLAGTIANIKPLGSGHINDSYRVSTTADATPDYLLQRINHEIFTNVGAMMRNIDLVTNHIRQRLTKEDGQDTLTIIPTKTGKLFYTDDHGNYWRVYEFLSGLQSYDLLETAEQAYEGARSYGYFLRFLDDLPTDQIVPVLPGFHNIVSRLSAFNQARSQVRGKLKSRASQCRPEINYVLSLAEGMGGLQRLWQASKLPTRITHNDTKFNNVMLTAAGKGRCVVDLDTVMPGIVHFDFGDGVRTGIATANEDEEDLALVDVDLDKFQGFAAGYLDVTRDYLSPTERQTLGQAGPLLAYIMGVRFLTDYLAGDVYYKIKHPEHNLVRARNQLQLVRVLTARSDNLTKILTKLR